MLKNLKKILSVTLLTVIISFFVYYIGTHLEDFKNLKLINPSLLIILGMLTIFSSTLVGLQTRYLLKPFGINLTWIEWFGLSVTTTFYNTITPFRGGAISRAHYLKRQHYFTYTNFLATMSGSYVINFLAQSIIGIISLLILYETKKIFNIYVSIAYLIFFIPLTILVLASPEFKHTKYYMINKIIDVANGWHKIRKNKQVVSVTLIVVLLQLVISSTSTIILYSTLGINISYAEALILTTLGALSIIIMITPAGLGIAEAVAVFSGLIIGIAPAEALTAALIGRAVSTLIIFILGPIFSYLLFKEFKK